MTVEIGGGTLMFESNVEKIAWRSISAPPPRESGVLPTRSTGKALQADINEWLSCFAKN